MKPIRTVRDSARSRIIVNIVSDKRADKIAEERAAILETLSNNLNIGVLCKKDKDVFYRYVNGQYQETADIKNFVEG